MSWGPNGVLILLRSRNRWSDQWYRIVGSTNNHYTPAVSPLQRVAHRPTWLLNQASARARAQVAEAFAAHGLRGYHFRLLAALDQYGPSTQADLGRSTDIDRSDVVAVVADLLDRGYATRKPDPVDRRRNIVSITKRGVAKLEELDTSLGEVQDSLLAPLSPMERKTL